jgi:hypothetical protein
MLCVAEFRSYFDHVRSLHFDDRPDYDYLKRMFRELFFRKGFRYDNCYDWDLSEQDRLVPEYTTGVDGIEPALKIDGPKDQDQQLEHEEEIPQSSRQQGDASELQQQEQPVMRIMSRGDRSSSQAHSSSQQLQSGSRSQTQPSQPTHGYQTRHASNTRR